MRTPPPHPGSPRKSPLPTPPMLKSRQFTRSRDLQSSRLRKTLRLTAVIFFTAIITFLFLTPWQHLSYPNAPHFTGAFSGVLKPGVYEQVTKWNPVRLGGSPAGIIVPGTVQHDNPLSDPTADHAASSSAVAAVWAETDGVHAAGDEPQGERWVEEHHVAEFEGGAVEVEKDLVSRSDERRAQWVPHGMAVGTVGASQDNAADGFEHVEHDLMSGASDKAEVEGTALGEEQGWANLPDNNQPFAEGRKEEQVGWEQEKDLVSASDDKREAGAAGPGEENVWADTPDVYKESSEKEGKREEWDGREEPKELISGSEEKMETGGVGLDTPGERTEAEGGFVVEKDLMSGLDETKEMEGSAPEVERDLLSEPTAKEDGNGSEGLVGGSEVNTGDDNAPAIEKNLSSGTPEGQVVAVGKDLGMESEKKEDVVAPNDEGGSKVEVERDLMSGPDDKTAKAGGEAEKDINEKMAMETEGGERHDAMQESGESGECLRHIMYDKPVKTGSTAVTIALRRLLESKGQKYETCSFDSCLESAKRVCWGEREKIHFVEHISAEEGLMDCLGRRGYYRVTSIREPLERWESSFLYNRDEKANHYGIAHTESYGRFMAQYPDCSMLDYYDGLGKICKYSNVDVDERVKRIVGRYDEIIDLYDDDMGEGQGQLRKLIAGGVAEVNRSKRPDGDFREWFDEGRLGPEKKLYEAFKKRQRELMGKEPRLCIG